MKIELSFEELQIIYNALTTDIKKDESKVSVYEINKMNKAEEEGVEYIEDIYVISMNDSIKWNKQLRSKINGFIQNYEN